MTEAVRIVQVATELPAHREEASTILTYLEQWMQGQSERDKEKARRIFRNSGVQARHSIIPIEEVFSLKSFAQRNDVFIREMIPLAEKVLKKALEAAAWLPTQVDYLITTLYGDYDSIAGRLSGKPFKNEGRRSSAARYRNGMCRWNLGA